MSIQKKLKLSIFVLVISLMIQMSSLTSGYNFNRWYTADGYYPNESNWICEIEHIGVYLDYESGLIQGIIMFKLRSRLLSLYDISVDKAYIFVDTTGAPAVIWSQTYSNYYVKYGGTQVNGYIIQTLNSGSVFDAAYSVTIWLKINQISIIPFVWRPTITKYIGQRLAFINEYNYYPFPEADELMVYSSPPPDAYI